MLRHFTASMFTASMLARISATSAAGTRSAISAQVPAIYPVKLLCSHAVVPQQRIYFRLAPPECNK
jgi:hypothetical protein